jgi:O-methyltransferase
MNPFNKFIRKLKAFVNKPTSDANCPDLPQDFSDQKIQIWQKVKNYTMTSPERIACMIDAAEYITTNDIPGAIVECGVWRGGSTMAAAFSLLDLGEHDRKLYLYDTFEGMPPPEKEDIRHDGVPAENLLHHHEKSLDDNYIAYAPIDHVKNNLLSTGYQSDHIHFVTGKVEDTIPGTLPGQIAILRLDTDWYASTLHELIHLYPKLSPGGILIIDDYGWWKGARKAVDEYFCSLNPKPFLSRIDDTGRSAVKPF